MSSASDDGPAESMTYVQRIIEDALKASELPYSQHKGAHGGLPGIVVELPGERRLKTNTILSIGEHSVRIEAFVCRKPDENNEGVYRFLLKRNRRYTASPTPSTTSVTSTWSAGLRWRRWMPLRLTGCSGRCSRR